MLNHGTARAAASLGPESVFVFHANHTPSAARAVASGSDRSTAAVCGGAGTDPAAACGTSDVVVGTASAVTPAGGVHRCADADPVPPASVAASPPHAASVIASVATVTAIVCWYAPLRMAFLPGGWFVEQRAEVAVAQCSPAAVCGGDRLGDAVDRARVMLEQTSGLAQRRANQFPGVARRRGAGVAEIPTLQAGRRRRSRRAGR